jgi:hypothetical protein
MMLCLDNGVAGVDDRVIISVVAWLALAPCASGAPCADITGSSVSGIKADTCEAVFQVCLIQDISRSV